MQGDLPSGVLILSLDTATYAHVNVLFLIRNGCESKLGTQRNHWFTIEVHYKWPLISINWGLIILIHTQMVIANHTNILLFPKLVDFFVSMSLQFSSLLVPRTIVAAQRTDSRTMLLRGVSTGPCLIPTVGCVFICFMCQQMCIDKIKTSYLSKATESAIHRRYL